MSTGQRLSPAVPHPLVVALGLEPHPEGGWFRETWRARAEVAAHGGVRPAGTGIHFLLLPGERSAWHRVASDELWMWQGGGRLTVCLAGTDDRPSDDVDRQVLGPDPAGGDALQVLV
nr:cupin domain-containing protein [Micromonospora sp. DSM 115978]